MTGQLLQLLLLLLVFGTPFLAPLVFFLVWRVRGGWLRKPLLWLSGGAFVAWCSLFVVYVIDVGPWRSGVLIQGMSPSGREYCVVQTYRGLLERYQVSFYIRDSMGVWQWRGLAHDDYAWRSPEVSFGETEVVVTRERNFRREIPLEGGGMRQHADLAPYNQPAGLTVADLSARHNQKYQ